jgi:hypothetical protein
MATDVDALINGLRNEGLREDCRDLVALMEDVTGVPARRWSDKLVGFGEYHYRYASGREGVAGRVGFSPTPRGLTIYIASGLVGYDDLLERLGRHRTGKVCVYVRRLGDVGLDVLRQLVERCVRHLDQTERAPGAIPRMSEMPPYVDE